MSLNFKNVISPWVQSTSITNRVLSPIDRFTACYNCMSKNFQNVISPIVECTDITNRVLKLIWPFYGLLQLYELKLQKCHISEFSVEVSQIVFSAHLTVLRLVTTVRVKTSKISYLREFSPQVSQIVFSAHLTVLRLVYNCMSKNFQNLISSWFQCTSITNRLLTSFDRFEAYYNCMS